LFCTKASAIFMEIWRFWNWYASARLWNLINRFRFCHFCPSVMVRRLIPILISERLFCHHPWNGRHQRSHQKDATRCTDISKGTGRLAVKPTTVQEARAISFSSACPRTWAKLIPTSQETAHPLVH
jgi:hypothetical protein